MKKRSIKYCAMLLVGTYTMLWIVSNGILQTSSSIGDSKQLLNQFTKEEKRLDSSSVKENSIVNTTNTVSCHVPPMRPRAIVGDINCSALIHSDPYEQERASKIVQRKTRNSDRDVVVRSSDCSTLRLRYRTCPNSAEEAAYPIAFSILCHKDASQVERLLRNIYQPQNVYCIHPDAKANADFLKAMNNIANCLPNVFVASKLERVVYESYSRLQADINCMKDLVNRPEKWRYVINLVGQAFPLKTNRELMKILQVYNGANDIEGLAASKFMQDRIAYKYYVKEHKGARLFRGPSRFREAPGNLTLIRGSAYGVFSREFLEFVLSDKLAQEFLEWSKETKTPDEHYWATLHQLHHNPHLKSPGGFKGRPENNTWLASYSKWQKVDQCGGKFMHYVCIYGVKDLPDLVTRKEFFANKFYENYQPAALDCLEEWLTNRTNEVAYFDLTFYKSLPFVRGVH